MVVDRGVRESSSLPGKHRRSEAVSVSADHKAPRQVRFVETIGRSPSGKVDYARHKAETAEWLGVRLGSVRPEPWLGAGHRGTPGSRPRRCQRTIRRCRSSCSAVDVASMIDVDHVDPSLFLIEGVDHSVTPAPS